MSCSAEQGHVFVRVSNNPFGQTYARTPLTQRGVATGDVARGMGGRHVRQHRSGRTGRDRITVVPVDFIAGRESPAAKVAVPDVGLFHVGKPIGNSRTVVGKAAFTSATTSTTRADLFPVFGVVLVLRVPPRGVFPSPFPVLCAVPREVFPLPFPVLCAPPREVFPSPFPVLRVPLRAVLPFLFPVLCAVPRVVFPLTRLAA